MNADRAKDLTKKIHEILTVECCSACMEPRFPQKMNAGDETKLGWPACVNEQCAAYGHQMASAAYRLTPRFSLAHENKIENLLLSEADTALPKPSLGKRIYRGALWLAVTAAIVAAMWLGVNGSKPAWNAFVFLQWLNTLIWIMLYSARNEKNYFSDFPAQSFPAWVYSVSDLAIALVLAAFGHFVYASFSIIQMLCEQGFYAARAKGQEPKAKS